jgi:hypothetical protein
MATWNITIWIYVAVKPENRTFLFENVKTSAARYVTPVMYGMVYRLRHVSLPVSDLRMKTVVPFSETSLSLYQTPRSHFPEYNTSCSKETITGPYSEPYEFTAHPASHIYLISVLILSYVVLVSQVVCFLPDFDLPPPPMRATCRYWFDTVGTKEFCMLSRNTAYIVVTFPRLYVRQNQRKWGIREMLLSVDILARTVMRSAMSKSDAVTNIGGCLCLSARAKTQGSLVLSWMRL